MVQRLGNGTFKVRLLWSSLIFKFFGDRSEEGEYKITFGKKIRRTYVLSEQ